MLKVRNRSSATLLVPTFEIDSVFLNIAEMWTDIADTYHPPPHTFSQRCWYYPCTKSFRNGFPTLRSPPPHSTVDDVPFQRKLNDVEYSNS
jgi:hypothetical protein